ncbi:MAG: hypothetical protein PGN11_09365 [Quadrisphaera sp.]
MGDRITSSARAALTRAGAGYLDLRGHLALRTDRIVVDSPVTPSAGRSDRKDGLRGEAGLAIAVWLLLSPDGGASVRHVARDLGRSPSTVSEVFGALRRDGLVDEELRPQGARLFEEVASRWPTARSPVRTAPATDPLTADATALALGLDDIDASAGWALTGTAAAAALGAPIAARAGGAPDLFVPDELHLRRAVRLLGAAPDPATAGALLRVAPVPQVGTRRSAPVPTSGPWPLAHPLFVALDLAQDRGRGREVLDAWTPRGDYNRVW